jgi:hypothetical protein
VLYTSVTDDQNDLPEIDGLQFTNYSPTRTDWSGVSVGLMHSF